MENLESSVSNKHQKQHSHSTESALLYGNDCDTPTATFDDGPRIAGKESTALIDTITVYTRNASLSSNNAPLKLIVDVVVSYSVGGSKLEGQPHLPLENDVVATTFGLPGPLFCPWHLGQNKPCLTLLVHDHRAVFPTPVRPLLPRETSCAP